MTISYISSFHPYLTKFEAKYKEIIGAVNFDQEKTHYFLNLYARRDRWEKKHFSNVILWSGENDTML